MAGIHSLSRLLSLYTDWLYLMVKVKVKPLSRVRLFATPWTVAHQAPPSIFVRHTYFCPGEMIKYEHNDN